MNDERLKNKQLLWKIAKSITEKQIYLVENPDKKDFSKLDKQDWENIEEEWFDYLVEELENNHL